MVNFQMECPDADAFEIWKSNRRMFFVDLVFVDFLPIGEVLPVPLVELFHVLNGAG